MAVHYISKGEPWDRRVLEGESPEAYAAFRAWLHNKNPESNKRDIHHAYQIEKPGLSEKASGTWTKWKTHWDWEKRAIAYDRNEDVKEARRQEIERMKDQRERQRKRAMIEEKEFALGALLMDQAELMAKMPLFDVGKDEDGNVVYIDRKSWNKGHAAAFGKLGSDLMRKSVGMPESTSQININNGDEDETPYDAKVKKFLDMVERIAGKAKQLQNENQEVTMIEADEDGNPKVEMIAPPRSLQEIFDEQIRKERDRE